MVDNKYFDKTKQQKALEWLEKKWHKDRQICECCGLKSWTLAEDLVMPLQFIGGGLAVGGNTYPHLLLTCNNCGYAKCFNAVIAGIVIPLGGKND